MKIDYYKKKTYKRPYRQFDITEILRQIQDGTYRNEVEKVRKAKTQEEKDTAKYEASGFTFSGTFKERRSDSLIQHSGLVAIDIDGLNERVREEKTGTKPVYLLRFPLNFEYRPQNIGESSRRAGRSYT